MFGFPGFVSLEGVSCGASAVFLALSLDGSLSFSAWAVLGIGRQKMAKLVIKGISSRKAGNWRVG